MRGLINRMGPKTRRLVHYLLVRECRTGELCDPECKSWLHMNEPFEIQACDECAIFQDDDDAGEAHDLECGCGWGTGPLEAEWCDLHQLYEPCHGCGLMDQARERYKEESHEVVDYRDDH